MAAQTEFTVHRRYLAQAEAAARRMVDALTARGLTPAFSDWLITDDAGRVVLFGVLDVRRLDRVERYTSGEVIHHLRTALRGLPVGVSNSSGLRYAVLLSPPPTLPRRVDFPGVERGRALLGVDAYGRTVSAAWSDLGHLLVAGMTGSGKSNFLRLLIYQALASGAKLLLASRKHTTFKRLEGHPALLGGAPVAHETREYADILAAAGAEIARRNALYAQLKETCESLEAYNRLAVKHGLEPLPRLLVVLDEYTVAVTEAGGPRSALAKLANEIAFVGREFGVNLALAAQAFDRATVGAVRGQTRAIAFAVESAADARMIGCEGAQGLRAPGRAISRLDRERRLVQTFFFDDALLGEVTLLAGLTAQERALVRWAVTENGGYLSLADIQARGWGKKAAERLAAEWEARGWLAKDREAGNRRRVTAALTDLLKLPANNLPIAEL